MDILQELELDSNKILYHEELKKLANDNVELTYYLDMSTRLKELVLDLNNKKEKLEQLVFSEINSPRACRLISLLDITEVLSNGPCLEQSGSDTVLNLETLNNMIFESLETLSDTDPHQDKRFLPVLGFLLERTPKTCVRAFVCSGAVGILEG